MAHGLDPVQQTLVHVDVDDLGAVFDLLAGDDEGLLEFAVEDVFGELGRAGHVGALADVHEVGAGLDRERLQPAQAEQRLDLRHRAGREGPDRLGNGVDVLRRGPAAAAHDVEPAVGREVLEVGSHVRGRLVEAAEGVGQAGIGIAAHLHRGDPGQLLDERAHLARSQGAVDPHAEQPGVGDGVPEGLHRLARKRAPALVGDGERHHQRQPPARLLEAGLDGEEGRLGIERVEDGLQQQQVRPALDAGPAPARHRPRPAGRRSPRERRDSGHPGKGRRSCWSGRGRRPRSKGGRGSWP